MKTVIVMSEADNIGNAIEDLAPGDEVGYEVDGKECSVACRTEIPYGFKMAIRPIARGQDVVKYREVIGVASQDIDAGECVHVHNIMGKRGRGDLEGAGQ